MNIQKFKKYVFALALGVGFVVAPGLSSLSIVQAQNYPWGQNRRNSDWERQREIERRREQRKRERQNDDYYGQVDRNGNIDRNRNGVDDRYENNGRYGRNDRYGRDDGYYDDNGYDYNNGDFQKGYRDGLDRGRKDAQTNRAMDPNNSSHYRKGNSSYRAGFERGFYKAFRQYSGRRW